MKYLIKIKTPGRMILVKGKMVRTPVEWIDVEQNIEGIKTRIKADKIEDYSIELYDLTTKVKPKIKPKVKPKIKSKVKPNTKKKTPKKTEPMSTLESFGVDEISE